MTQLQTLGYAASTWVPRGDGFAFMPCRCVTEDDPDGLVVDLADELRSRLTWGSAETVVAVPAAPTGELRDDQVEVGGLVVSLSPNQASPLFADGSEAPDLSPVTLELRQRLSHDVDDLHLLITRRKDVRAIVHGLDGQLIGRAP